MDTNRSRRLKPNLLDPIISKKIVYTLNPPIEDYWGPTKSKFRIFYENYIKTNIGLIIFVVFVLIFLIYRYRIIKKDREEKELEKIYNQLYNPNQPLNTEIATNNLNIQTPNNNSVSNHNSMSNNNSVPNNSVPNNNFDQYTQLILQAYNQQKENLREPLNYKQKTKPVSKPKFAYPIYPAKGGSLMPAGGR